MVSIFGSSIAAVGSDKVLIGGSGAVSLFDVNGTLLMTITNPSVFPDPEDAFGRAMAAVGTDKVLIGASGVDIRGFAEEVGAAYLFCYWRCRV